MTIRRISIISIPVSDQQRALAYYRDVLGMQVVRDDEFMHANARWIELRPHGAETNITLTTWFENLKPGGVTGTVLTTDNLDGDLATLIARGFKSSPIDSAPWGRYVTFSDPDGNGWVLQQNVPGMD